MKREIKDFSLSRIFLESYCKNMGVPFKNIPVFIDEDDVSCESDVILCINNSQNVCETSFRIIKEYLEKSDFIYGKSILRIDVLEMLQKYFDDIYDAENNFMEQDPFQRSLYQNSYLWILFDKIICPAYNIRSKNISLMMVTHPYVDVSLLVEKEDEEYILVNIIGNESIQDAFTFVKILDYYGIDKTTFIKDFLSGEIFKIFLEFSLMARGPESTSDFIDAIINIIDKNLYFYLSIDDKRILNIKTAQNMYDSDMFNPWWILGLTEQMLAPVQQPNGKLYRNTEQNVVDFWKSLHEDIDLNSTTLERLLRYRVDYEKTKDDIHSTIGRQINKEHGI